VSASLQIWVRNYQILEQQPSNAKEAHQAKKQLGQEQNTSLVEIGPRFVLNPIRIFRGSFGGQTLYANPDFVSPNDIRAIEKKRKGTSYEQRKQSQKQRKTRHENMVLPEDPLDSVFR
jgi:ribosome biogenesis protein BRX1